MPPDNLYIGSVPGDEGCVQVGRPDYRTRARRECRAFIAQLRRRNGSEPEGARLYVAENPHDFGTYLSVNCSFDPLLPESVDYAFQCEGDGFPERWDERAREDLAELLADPDGKGADDVR